MSSLEDWKPLTAFCMLGAVIHQQALAVRFDTYREPSGEKRDELFAQALYEVVQDISCECGEVPMLLARVRVELSMGSRMERMHVVATEAFLFVGIKFDGPFLLPAIDRVGDLKIIFKAYLGQHPEWREPAMAVSDRFITLLEEHMVIS